MFGSSTTQLLHNISFALTFSEGDEIIVSSIDHEANIGPWVDLAARHKLTLKWWTPTPPSSSPNPNPILTAASLTPLLTPRTRLVSCTHASNVLGSANPIAEVTAAVRASPSPNALVVVDGVSWAPHRPIDVRALDVDVYAFSWYKVYGPHIAMLYASQRAQGQMRSLGHYFKKGDTLEEKSESLNLSYCSFTSASYDLVVFTLCSVSPIVERMAREKRIRTMQASKTSDSIYFLISSIYEFLKPALVSLRLDNPKTPTTASSRSSIISSAHYDTSSRTKDPWTEQRERESDNTLWDTH